MDPPITVSTKLSKNILNRGENFKKHCPIHICIVKDLTKVQDKYWTEC